MQLIYIYFLAFLPPVRPSLRASQPLLPQLLDVQNDWGVLAGCKCGWQSAKSEKSPRPKNHTIARCEVYLSMYIAYISVSKLTPWAVEIEIPSHVYFSWRMVAVMNYNISAALKKIENSLHE